MLMERTLTTMAIPGKTCLFLVSPFPGEKNETRVVHPCFRNRLRLEEGNSYYDWTTTKRIPMTKSAISFESTDLLWQVKALALILPLRTLGGTNAIKVRNINLSY